MRVVTRQGAWVIPPTRAVWIPPQVQHTVVVLESAELRTVDIAPAALPASWADCRVLVVSPLLRELIGALQGSEPGPREDAVMALALDEIQHADTQALGVPMPHPVLGDKRLRALCEAVLRDPAEKNQLREWVAEVGASERTVARLFRDELGTSYQQWRTQAVLAHALPQLARGVPIAQVAAASGYASDSAFSGKAPGSGTAAFQAWAMSGMPAPCAPGIPGDPICCSICSVRLHCSFQNCWMGWPGRPASGSKFMLHPCSRMPFAIAWGLRGIRFDCDPGEPPVARHSPPQKPVPGAPFSNRPCISLLSPGCMSR